MRLKLLQSTLLILFSFIWGLLCVNGEKNSSNAVSKAILDLNETLSKKSLAYVIPIREQIGPPILDITRRGLKNAISKSADIVILDMDTPGGELGVTLEIMEEIIENIERFEGRIFTYVNDEAISAGAYIAIATSEIAFSPKSQIGAAEAVSGGGGNIDSSMKRKINSYLKAKIRNYAGDYPYRSQVMSAMMDANESLVIDGEPIRTAEGNLIKKKGELLTLTGTEACELYGNPPTPLLGFGVFESVEDLLDDRVGENNWTLEKMEINWAEEIGLWLNGIAPLILSIGLVCIFVEFKTPGFGIFGVAGLLLLLVFFGSKYIAGLAGQEELLIFLLGTCLVLVEIFLVPGMIIPGLLGMILMVGGLFWAMVDIWPTPDFSWSMEVLRPPLLEMLQTMGLTICFGFLAAKILPKTSIWQKLILNTSITGSVRNQKESEQAYSEIIGKLGTATTELFPSGQIEVEGNRYDARSTLGKISKGERVEVIRASEFDIVVKVV